MLQSLSRQVKFNEDKIIFIILFVDATIYLQGGKIIYCELVIFLNLKLKLLIYIIYR